MRKKRISPKVIIIEDDISLSIVIKRTLETMGYIVNTVADGESGADEALTNKYSLIIIDISLPRLSGFGVLTKLKTAGLKTPTIVITNFEVGDSEIRSYLSGANIFHKKPLDFELLKAQVRMLLGKYRFNSQIEIGDLVIDTQKHTVKKGDGYIDLTKKEFDLLLLMCTSPGEIFSRREIIEYTHMDIREVEEGSVDTLVSRVRGKLHNGKSQEIIETVYRRGYRLCRAYLDTGQKNK